MVEFTNAVTYPRTVVVHSLDTFLANSAVMKSLFLNKVALETITDLVQRDYFLP